MESREYLEQKIECLEVELEDIYKMTDAEFCKKYNADAEDRDGIKEDIVSDINYYKMKLEDTYSTPYDPVEEIFGCYSNMY